MLDPREARWWPGTRARSKALAERLLRWERSSQRRECEHECGHAENDRVDSGAEAESVAYLEAIGQTLGTEPAPGSAP